MAEKPTPSLSIVVPCYNEVASLSELHRRLSAVCSEAKIDAPEIVLVDDGSTDGSWPLMQTLAQDDPCVLAIKLSRNHGHQAALSAGLALCSGDRILILDADLQDPPECLPKMMELMDQGAEVVFGQRRARQGETLFKRSSASLFYRLLNKLVDIDIPQDTGDFRLISRRALDILNAMPERCRFIRGMVSWIGLKQVPLLYDRAPRFAGETKYPFRKMFGLAFDAITSFSTFPMKLVSTFGILSGLVALGLLFYVLGSWLFGHTVPGWTSLGLIVLSIGSIQLLSLGLFGEYLARLYLESKQRPLFIIDQIVGKARQGNND